MEFNTAAADAPRLCRPVSATKSLVTRANLCPSVVSIADCDRAFGLGNTSDLVGGHVDNLGNIAIKKT